MRMGLEMGKTPVEQMPPKGELAEFFAREENFSRRMKLITGFYNEKIQNDPTFPSEIKNALSLVAKVSTSPWTRPSPPTNQSFYNAIEAGFANPQCDVYMADLLSAVNLYSLFVNYQQTNPQQMARMNQLFTEYCVQNSGLMHIKDSKTNLDAYLAEPFQRIMRYEMPLKELMALQEKKTKLTTSGTNTTEEEKANMATELARVNSLLADNMTNLPQLAEKATRYAVVANATQTLNQGLNDLDIKSAATLFDRLENAQKKNTKKDELISELQKAVNRLTTETVRIFYTQQCEQNPQKASVLLLLLAKSNTITIPPTDKVAAFVELSTLFLAGKISSHEKAEYASRMLKEAKGVYLTALQDGSLNNEQRATVAIQLDKAITVLHEHCLSHNKQIDNLPTLLSGKPPELDKNTAKKPPGMEFITMAKKLLSTFRSTVTERVSTPSITPVTQQIETKEIEASKPAMPDIPPNAIKPVSNNTTQHAMKSALSALRGGNTFQLAKEREILPFDSVHLAQDKSYASFKVQTDGSADRFLDFCDASNINYKVVSSRDKNSDRVQITVSGSELRKLEGALQIELKKDNSIYIEVPKPS